MGWQQRPGEFRDWGRGGFPKVDAQANMHDGGQTYTQSDVSDGSVLDPEQTLI